VASDLGMVSSDSSMSDGRRSTILFLTCAIAVLTLGVVVRTAGLLQSNAIASESNEINLQMEILRNRLGKIKQADTDLDDVKWSRIQNDLRTSDPELLSKTQIVWQRFDPAARVRLLPGLDGQPGTIDFDDNANGVTDDAGELGATYSDDLCVVEAPQSTPSKIKPSVVLQRGAYIAAEQISTKQFLHSDRVLILYQGKDDSWSLVLDW
jgi:hypothetical protein